MIKPIPQEEQNVKQEIRQKSISLSNNLHKPNPPTPINLRPHRKRHLHPSSKLLTLPLHLTEYRHVLLAPFAASVAAAETRLDVEFQPAPVLAHQLQSFREGRRARVRDVGVPARAAGGFGDVPVRAEECDVFGCYGGDFVRRWVGHCEDGQDG